MIKLGRTNYWFTGERFFFGDREKQRDLTYEDREPLLRYLCSCAFGLNRWQGEANDFRQRWSVGEHSILVAALAGRLAILRGLDADAVAKAVRLGAIHDLGETLGLGDIAAPWLRSARGGDLRDWCEEHQAHALRLTDHWGGPSPIIKDADHLAAALERRIFFGDFTGDMEHPDVPRLVVEVFGRWSWDDIDNEGHDLVYPYTSEALLDLILGGDDENVYVLGDIMIDRGKAVVP